MDYKKIVEVAGKIVSASMDEVEEFAAYEADGSYAGRCVSLRLWDDGTLVCDDQVSSNSFPPGEHYVVRRLEGYPDDEPVDVGDILSDVVEGVEDELISLARHDERIQQIFLDYLENEQE